MSFSVRAGVAVFDLSPAQSSVSDTRRRPARRADEDRPGPVRLIECRDADTWNRLADQPGGSVYHRWQWLSWIAPLLGAKFVPLVVVHRGRQVGIAPVLLRRQLGFASANVVPFPYLGPVVPAELVATSALEVMRWARRHGVMSLTLCLHPSLGAPEGSLRAAGLVEEVADTYVVDVKGLRPDDLFARIGGDARTAIRRSIKKGVSVRAATPEDLCEILPAVHDESLGGTSRYGHAIGGALGRGSLPVAARTAAAVVDGRTVGVSITLGSARTAVGWIGAVHRADQRTQANAALVWDAITWSGAQGYDSLDMCGAPDPGIAAYKSKFRPRVERHLVGRWQAPVVARIDRFRHRPPSADAQRA